MNGGPNAPGCVHEETVKSTGSLNQTIHFLTTTRHSNGRTTVDKLVRYKAS